MKNTFKWMFAAILVCSLTISSCKKDPEPTPDPEPQTVTRVAKETGIISSSVLTVNACRTFTWENGDLMRIYDTVITMPLGIQHFYQNNMVYENGNLMGVEEENIPWAWAIKDGDGTAVARFMSKHNQIEEGYTYNYDENSLLTSIVAENDSTFYQYIEQTVE